MYGLPTHEPSGLRQPTLGRRSRVIATWASLVFGNVRRWASLHALQGGAGFGNLRQLGSRVLEVAQEFLIGVDGIGFPAGLLENSSQVKLTS